jgi:hypothetical protein
VPYLRAQVGAKMSDNAEWLRVWHIVERYLSDVDVLDPAELTNLIVPTDAK